LKYSQIRTVINHDRPIILDSQWIGLPADSADSQWVGLPADSAVQIFFRKLTKTHRKQRPGRSALNDKE
jgi:hypothetical protein